MNSAMSSRLIVRVGEDLIYLRQEEIRLIFVIQLFFPTKKMFCNRNLEQFKYIVKPSVEIFIILNWPSVYRMASAVFGIR